MNLRNNATNVRINEPPGIGNLRVRNNEPHPEKRPQNQNAFIKINDLGVILRGKEFYIRNNAHNFFILSLVFLKLLNDRKCCILSEPPCIATRKLYFTSNFGFVFVLIVSSLAKLYRHIER